MATNDETLDVTDLPQFRAGRGRKASNAAFWSLCVLALLCVLGPTVWLVGGVLAKSLPHWNWALFSRTTSGESGGLENAIVGTVVLVVGVLLVSGIISVLAGVYISELSKSRRLGSALSGAYEVLAGVPSIVLGYVGYIAFVVYFHWGFSLLAAVLTLSIFTMPYIIRSTVSALGQVPTAYREGADALGLPTGWALRRIVLKSALPGIITGLLIALAIAVGETAPLLYTAGWSDTLPHAAALHAPLAYLTYPVWTFYNQPSESAKQLSYDAAALLIVLVFVLILLGRLISRWSQRHADR